MATTTKTLTPTNQTITLPDMTERPNASILVDGIGKDADAINALSDQMANIGTPLKISQTTAGTLTGAIIEKLSELNVGDTIFYTNSNDPSDKPDDGHKWGPVFLLKWGSAKGFVMYFDSSNGTKIGYTTDMQSIVWT